MSIIPKINNIKKGRLLFPFYFICINYYLIFDKGTGMCMVPKSDGP